MLCKHACQEEDSRLGWSATTVIPGTTAFAVVSVESSLVGHQLHLCVVLLRAMTSRYFNLIREYGSTLYVGMTREKNGGRIKRVH